MLIAFALVQVVLIGSLFALASDNDQVVIPDDEIIDTCTGDCANCTDCTGDGDCQGKGNLNCDGTGSCNHNQIRNTNCNTVCDGSGSYKQNTQQIRGCGTSSSCSGSCNN